MDNSYHCITSLKNWFCDLADLRIQRVVADYNFLFYVLLVALSGEEVRDHIGQPVRMLYAWWAGFDRVWRDVYYVTGGRIQHMVLRQVVVNKSNALRMRWWDLLSRSEARESTAESPCVIGVFL